MHSTDGAEYCAHCLPQDSVSRDHRVPIGLRVLAQRGLNFLVPQNPLNSLGLFLLLIDQPIGKAVTKVVQTEEMTVRNLDTCGFGCRPKMICHEG